MNNKMKNSSWSTSNYRKNPENSFLDLESSNEAVWIKLTAYRIKSQSAGARINLLDTIEPVPGAIFEFLAPNEIMETLSHEYGSYDSIASRMSQVTGALGKTAEEIKGVGHSVLEATRHGNSLKSAANAAAGQINQTNVEFYRPDEAMVYQNTNRRGIEFSFKLFECGDPKKYIVDIINELLSMSSPQKTDNLSGILPPYLFHIQTSNVVFLDIEACALESVQYTYSAPYINGYPSSCELTLSFKQILPVFDDLFSNIKKISVTSTGMSVKDRAIDVYQDVKGRIAGSVNDTLSNVKDNITNKAKKTVGW